MKARKNNVKERKALKVPYDLINLAKSKNQSEKICLETIIHDDELYSQFMENQTEGIAMEAVKQNSYSLRYLKDEIKSDLHAESIKRHRQILNEKFHRLLNE